MIKNFLGGFLTVYLTLCVMMQHQSRGTYHTYNFEETSEGLEPRQYYSPSFSLNKQNWRVWQKKSSYNNCQDSPLWSLILGVIFRSFLDRGSMINKLHSNNSSMCSANLPQTLNGQQGFWPPVLLIGSARLLLMSYVLLWLSIFVE